MAHPIVFIDGSGTPGLPSSQWRVVPLDDGLPREIAGECDVVVSVDLRDVEVVRMLRRALDAHREGCRLFLVDPQSRVTSVHADVLGADVQLPVSSTVADISGALSAFHQHPDGPGPAVDQVAMSMGEGMQTLRGAFRALSEQSKLDGEDMRRTSESISEALAVQGLHSWVARVREHHAGTYQHCLLVTGLAAGFGCMTGMRRSDVARLALAGLLHDIGKAIVPAEILDKPGALTAEEVKAIRMHPGQALIISPIMRRSNEA